MIVVPARIVVQAVRPLFRFFDRYLMTPVFDLLSEGLDRAIGWLFARCTAGIVAAARWFWRWLDPWLDRVVAGLVAAAQWIWRWLDSWLDRVVAGVVAAARWPWRHLVVPAAKALARAFPVVWSWVIGVPRRAYQRAVRTLRPVLRWLADRLGRVVAVGWRSVVRPIAWMYGSVWRLAAAAGGWLARRVMPMAMGLWALLRLALRLARSWIIDMLLDVLGLPFQRLIFQIVRLLIPALDWLADRLALASAAAWRLFVRAAGWVYRSLLRPAGTAAVWLWRHSAVPVGLAAVWLWRHSAVPAGVALVWVWRHSAKPAGAAIARGWWAVRPSRRRVRQAFAHVLPRFQRRPRP